MRRPTTLNICTFKHFWPAQELRRRPASFNIFNNPGQEKRPAQAMRCWASLGFKYFLWDVLTFSLKLTFWPAVYLFAGYGLLHLCLNCFHIHIHIQNKAKIYLSKPSNVQCRLANRFYSVLENLGIKLGAGPR